MQEFGVEGMKCQTCVGKITDALLEAGYKNVFVSLDPPILRLESDAHVSKEDVNAKLAELGTYNVSHKSHDHTSDDEKSDERLTPLFVIVSYITGGVLLRALMTGNFGLDTLMNNFMGGFFVIFSLFKLLSHKEFAEAYASYDIVAARSRAYALAYPFIELLLGVCYFAGIYPVLTNTITLVLMAIGSFGVYNALKSKRKIQCACLGTVLKLPMTKVTLIEDVTMGLMALVMIFDIAH